MLAAILGAPPGPLASAAGARLGVVLGASLPPSLGAIAVAWGVALPALGAACDQWVPRGIEGARSA